MSDIAKLGFVVDTSDVKRAERDVEALGDAAETTERQVNRASAGIRGSASRIQQSLAGAATRSGAAWTRFREQMSGAGALAGGALAAGLSIHASRAIEAAKNQQEAASMFNEVFKDQAEATRRWSRDLGREINRSAYELQGQAAQFQGLLANMVPDRSDAADMSRVLTGLSQDLASFRNTSADQAMNAIRSGLIGEAEGLRNYGIILSAAAVETEALALGIADTKAEITEADKVMARYSLITKGMGDALGDAAKTSDSLSNEQKGLSGAINDLYIGIGQYLLPVTTSLVGFLRDMVGAFNSLNPETQKFIAYAVGIAAALGPVLIGVGVLGMALPVIAAGFGLLVSPIGLLVGGLAAVSAAVIYAISNWDSLTERFPILQRVVDAAKRTFEIVATFLRGDFAGAFGMIGELVQGAIANFQEFAPSIIARVQEMVDGIRDKFVELASAVVGWSADVVQGAVSGLAGLYQAGVDAIQQLWDGMKAKMAELKAWLSAELAEAVSIRPGSVLDRLGSGGRPDQSTVDSLAAHGRDIAEGLARGIESGQSDVSAASKAMADTPGNVVRDINQIQSPSRLMIEYGKYLSQGLGVGIQNGVGYSTTAAEGMVGSTVSVVDGMRDALKSVFQAGVQDWSNFGEAIKNTFLSKLQEMASSLMNSGIDGLFGALFGGVQGSDVLSNALRAIPGLATGGTVRQGGWAMVGERGPELVNLPGRSTVYDANQTKAAQSVSGLSTIKVELAPELIANVLDQAEQNSIQISQGVATEQNRYFRNELNRATGNRRMA